MVAHWPENLFYSGFYELVSEGVGHLCLIYTLFIGISGVLIWRGDG